MAIPLTEFRKKKLFHVFEVFFDTNHSGTIDRNDFDIAIKNVCFYCGWHDKHDRATDTKRRFLLIWESLKDQARISGEIGEVTQEEWYKLWDNPMNIQSWQQNYMLNMFAIFDSSSDGVIDITEFCSMCSCYGIQLADSRKAYLLFSKGNSVTVNQEYFKGLWHEYFYGEDPAALGNFIFGRVDWD